MAGSRLLKGNGRVVAQDALRPLEVHDEIVQMWAQHRLIEIGRCFQRPRDFDKTELGVETAHLDIGR